MTDTATVDPIEISTFEFGTFDEGMIVVRGEDVHVPVIPAEVDGKPVVGIGENAFKGLTEVKEVRIPDTVRFIGDSAFENCINLATVEFSNNLESIGNGGFRNCSSLKKIDLNDGLKSIGQEAFLHCSKAELNGLPQTLAHIGTAAFGFCRSIKSFEFRSRNPKYMNYGAGLYERLDSKLVAYAGGGHDMACELYFDTTEILPQAFRGCDNFRILAIPGRLKTIADDAFMDCRCIGDFSVSRNQKKFTGKGSLVDTESMTLLYVRPNRRSNALMIQGDIRHFGSCCFQGCEDIEMVDLPQDLQDVPEGCMEALINLNRLQIPSEMKAELPYRFFDEEGNELAKDEIDGYNYDLRKEGEFVRESEYSEDLIEEDDFGIGLPSFLRRRMEPQPMFTPANIHGTSMDDIGGNKALKEDIINRVVMPAKHPEVYKKYGIATASGILMYGPPGTGKTMMARAVASELGAAFFPVQASDILAKYVGENEERIRNLFECARATGNAVIFFDDFDSIGLSRNSSDRDWRISMVNELLTQMQGIEQFEGRLLVLAATNRPWALDSALKRSGRFDTEILVPLPDEEAREHIIRKNLEKLPRKGIRYGELAKATHGYNGADVAELCKRAKVRRAMIEINGGKEGLCMEDFREVLKTMKSTVNPQDLLDILNYAQTGRAPVSEKKKSEGEEEYRPIQTQKRDPIYG
ncbi:MAG: leucine-rich repeat protein [archaeon]|nr:leucine-rich repeat protein [archaeon]